MCVEEGVGKGVFVAGWEAPTLTCGGAQGYPQRPQEGSSFWRVETNGMEIPLDRGALS